MNCTIQYNHLGRRLPYLIFFVKFLISKAITELRWEQNRITQKFVTIDVVDSSPQVSCTVPDLCRVVYVLRRQRYFVMCFQRVLLCAHHHKALFIAAFTHAAARLDKLSPAPLPCRAAIKIICKLLMQCAPPSPGVLPSRRPALPPV